MPNKNFYYIHLLNITLLLCSNFLFLIEQYEHTKLFCGVTLYLLVSFILISLITYSAGRLLFIIANSVFYLAASAISYFKYHYKIIVSPTLIQSIINTDQLEAFELLNKSLVVWILTSGILPCAILIAAILFFKAKNQLMQIIKSFIMAVILIVISLGFVGYNIYGFRLLNNSLLSFMPYNYVLALKNYLQIYTGSDQKEMQKLTEIFSYKNNNPYSDLKVILVIGESARSDHMALNGYHRQTSPNLTIIDNIISYKEAYSNATNTPLGIQAIMKKRGHYTDSSFIGIFNHLKFKTYWISNQGTKYRMINSIATEASFSIFSDEIRGTKLGNNYDEDLLPFIKKAAKDDNSGLIIIHTMGSHRLYDLRYPPEFKKFTPTCIKDQLLYSSNECKNSEELINSYDNSILYTDYFISEVIRIFSDKRAFLIYVSDHGESLGENNIYAHAYPLEIAPKEQLHIPLILWGSKEFLSDTAMKQNFENARYNANVRLNSERFRRSKFKSEVAERTLVREHDRKVKNSAGSIFLNEAVTQQYIFHTILDCLNIKSESIDLTKSLCKIQNQN